MLLKIKELRNKMGLTLEELASKSGVSKRMISAYEAGTNDITLKKMQLIAEALDVPFYNLVEPGKDINNDDSKISEPSAVYKSNKTEGIPLVSIEAVAGLRNGSFKIEQKDIINYYVIPEFKEADFMIRVNGSSMIPTYNSGDVVACKILHEKGFIQWHKVHALATSEQGVLIKRLKKSKKENVITAISDNKEYDPFDISWKDITGIAIVLGGIKIE